ncbi:hypothetical protein [Marinobacterium rhizophilum]|uniref:Uncharacterized protein n=1 Tax=Marinobacterium rhizophilum TaxID=420402 RepID=A0ABY5HME8_9GAMM|nr:hypothetical protein [Marinobacterium rhizophilum]UTW13480.1 hypothetical protein KDW95_07500 [Marinobacterium rhizophilum]
MTRLKKKRSDANRIEWGETAPRRSEKLADPTSYESRKRRSLDNRKKQKSVYEKQLEKEEREARLKAQQPQGGRLAEKIRRLNREKNAAEMADAKADSDASVEPAGDDQQDAKD